MFLHLSHTKLDVFAVSKQFVLSCYEATNSFPSMEKFALTQQIRRAALSVHLNVAEGCSRKSLAERRLFYEVARGSAIEVDAALDIAVNLRYTSNEELTRVGSLLIRAFQLISKMMG